MTRRTRVRHHTAPYTRGYCLLSCPRRVRCAARRGETWRDVACRVLSCRVPCAVRRVPCAVCRAPCRASCFVIRASCFVLRDILARRVHRASHSRELRHGSAFAEAGPGPQRDGLAPEAAARFRCPPTNLERSEPAPCLSRPLPSRLLASLPLASLPLAPRPLHSIV